MYCGVIIVIRKVSKREHQNPEFGHKQGEIQNKPAKKYISIQGGSFTLYFFFPERLHCWYMIFTAPTRTGIINPLDSCPLSVEFQHFILRFNKSS